MTNFLIDGAGDRWSFRRTCIDAPDRAYYLQRMDLVNPHKVVMAGVIGFYSPSIDQAKARLNGKA